MSFPELRALRKCHEHLFRGRDSALPLQWNNTAQRLLCRRFKYYVSKYNRPPPTQTETYHSNAYSKTEAASLWCVTAAGRYLGTFEADLEGKPSVAAPDTVCSGQDRCITPHLHWEFHLKWQQLRQMWKMPLLCSAIINKTFREHVQMDQGRTRKMLKMQCSSHSPLKPWIKKA